MVWAMEDGRPGLVDLAGTIQEGQSGPLFFAAAKPDRKEAWELIKNWVDSGRKGLPGGKRIQGQAGGRDQGLSDEQIATNLFMILFGPTVGKVAEARAGLVRALSEFAGLRADATKRVLTDEQVDAWLQTVLDAWVELVEREVGRELLEVCGKEWAR
jgi:hypothetical protein